MLARHRPSPISFVCGGLLFVLLGCFGALASVVVPPLLELLPTSPHLAMLGLLALVSSPALAITIAHHFGSSALDSLERLTPSRRRPVLPDVESWAAGAHGWLVLYGTTLLTNFILLVLNPPDIEPEHVSQLSATGIVSGFAVAHVVSAHSLTWVLVATMFFELHRRAKRQAI